jgi:hypothetical protein
MYTNGIGTDIIRISHNKVMDNSISSEVAYGAGIHPSNWGDVNYLIANNIITGNKINALAGGCGGIDIYNHFPVVRNNVIAHNSGLNGGGIFVEFYPPVTGTTTTAVRGPRGLETKILQKTIRPSIEEMANLANNTIFGNSATISGGGVKTLGVTLQILNFIIWGNTAPDGAQISGSADVHYSDIEGGWAGTGNIDANPRLLGPYLFLKAKSPCIDAGNPDPMYDDPENMARPGYAQWPAMGMLRNDMGAYGGPGVADWWDFFDFPKGKEELTLAEADKTITDNQENPVKTEEFPNPFNNQTTIQFELPQDGFVSLKIYNVLGQEVANLVSQTLTAGSHKYVWNANSVASGIYFYRLESDGKVYRKKLILMK